jgi:multisubunit Na+/H+ antiporter MnhB subunit
VLLSIAAKPFNPTITDYYAVTSLAEAFGRNVVNVILVDFRALDTLGEIAVVAFAAIAAWAVLTGGSAGAQDDISRWAHNSPALPSLIFATTARMFFVLMLVVSVFVLFRGHNEPGGGFIGGLIASAGFAVLALASVSRQPASAAAAPGRVDGHRPGAGDPVRCRARFINESFLTHQWIDLNLGFTSLKLGTTYLFDIGVYLTVVGGVLAFLIRVQQQNWARSRRCAIAPTDAPVPPQPRSVRMIYVYAATIAIVAGAGIYMILAKNIVRIILGVALLAAAANLLIFLSGRLGSVSPPIIPKVPRPRRLCRQSAAAGAGSDGHRDRLCAHRLCRCACRQGLPLARHARFQPDARR